MLLSPDVLVLQECENIEKLKTALDSLSYQDIIWQGKNPNKGLAIISFNGYKLAMDKNYNQEIEYVIPVNVTKNANSLKLFNIWAMPHKTKKKSYVGQVWEAIHFYSDSLNFVSILLGDFNSNAIWDHERQPMNHSGVVEFLKKKDIISLYHNQSGEKQGEESQPTIYLLKNKQKPYHLDYCFCSQSLTSNKTNITVGQHADWIKLSDHMPLIINHILF